MAKAEKTTARFTTLRTVLRSTVAVIDTVVQRGGFKGEELSTIGQLRDQAVQIVQLVENHESDISGLTY